MSYQLKAQWSLPGYQVVSWHDEAAKDTSRRVSVGRLQLKSWLGSRRQTVESLYISVGGQRSQGLSKAELEKFDAQLVQRLSDAFSQGKLVALKVITPTAQNTPKPLQKKVVVAPVVQQRSTPSPTTPRKDEEVNEPGIVFWNGTPALRLRSSPEISEKNVLGTLPFNTRIQVLKRHGNGWLQVATPEGRTGYVAAQYIWCPPEHRLPEPRARLHQVAKGIPGTAIAIAEQYYHSVAARWGQDLRFFVNVLASVNQIPVPDSVSGWKTVQLQADRYIWIPSVEFALSLKDKVSSGSYSHIIADAVDDALKRLAQVMADFAQAIKLSGKYMGPAILKHVEESLLSILESLLWAALISVGAIALLTALGAVFGGPAGAAACFEASLAVLEYLGLVFLVKWLVDGVARIGSALVTFFRNVWDARGDHAKVDAAARALADAVGLTLGLALEALVMWGAAKGVDVALGKLKGTRLEQAFGENRLGSWLKDRVSNYRAGRSPIPGPRQVLKQILAWKKGPTTPLVRLATQAYPRYSKELQPAKALIARLFKGLGEVQGRAKDPVSAANRLQRAIDRFGAKVTSVQEVLANLWDAIGTRLVLSDTSAEGVNQLVLRLAELMRRGELQAIEINNLHGPQGKPYFSLEQIALLESAAAEGGQQVFFGKSKEMASGYTVVCAYLKHANGVLGELQIIGPKVLEIANAEHIPYDVLLDKPLVRDVPPAAEAELKSLVEPVKTAMESLTEGQRVQYLDYLNREYIQARNVELGKPSEKPKLPQGMSEVLSIEQIQKLERAIAAIKAKYQGNDAKVMLLTLLGAKEAGSTMRGILDDAKLREALKVALRQLREGAGRVPEAGDFSPLRARFSARALVGGAGDVELSVGSASRQSSERKRYLKVSIFTPSGGSETSLWLANGSTAEVLHALQGEASLIDKAREAIEQGALSLQRQELP